MKPGSSAEPPSPSRAAFLSGPQGYSKRTGDPELPLPLCTVQLPLVQGLVAGSWGASPGLGFGVGGLESPYSPAAIRATPQRPYSPLPSPPAPPRGPVLSAHGSTHALPGARTLS